jgi:hypothetical protein
MVRRVMQFDASGKLYFRGMTQNNPHLSDEGTAALQVRCESKLSPLHQR